MPQHLGRIADQLPGRDLADFDRVVRNQTVPALDQLDGGLALSDAAVAVDQNALAGNFNQHAVARDARGKRLLEIGDEAGNDIRCRRVGAQHGHIIFFSHLQTLRQRLIASGNHQNRNLIG